MIWNTEFAISILPLVLQGFLITLKATAGGTVLALMLGLFLALTARSGFRGGAGCGLCGDRSFSAAPRSWCIFYLLFFALPQAGVVLSPLTAGILALGLHSGSYMAAGVPVGNRRDTARPVGGGKDPWLFSARYMAAAS